MSNKYQITIKSRQFLYAGVHGFELRSYQFAIYWCNYFFLGIYSLSLCLCVSVSLTQTRTFLLGPHLNNSTKSSMKADASLQPGT